MNFSPRWYQQEAIDAIFNYLNGSDAGHPLVCLPTGSGKSLLQAMIVDEMSRRKPSARILFLTHQQELIRQNFNELIANMGALVDAGIYSAGLDSRDTDNKIIFAGIQSVHKKADDLGQFNLVVIDECFTGETKILTPEGEKRIDNMCYNDIVYNANGRGRVLSVSKKIVASNKLYILELSNGKNITCTGSHKFFTKNGWKACGELERGENLFGRKAVCAMWENFSSMDKSRKWYNKILFSRKKMERTKMLFAILCEEIEKSDAQFKIKRKNEKNIKKNRTSTKDARWERSPNRATNSLAIDAVERMDCRILGSNKKKKNRKNISDILQNRRSESNSKNWIRNRWQNALWGTIKKRFKKNELTERIRVVNISHKKREGNEFVYNLQISGHPSYYAGGALVHNCHLIPKKGEGMYRTFLAGQAPFTKFIGLTATPYRLESGLLTEGPGNIFDEIIYDVSIKRLIDEGFLCLLIGKNGVVRPDVSLVHRRGKEFIENELAAVCDDSVLIRDAVAEMLSLTVDRKHVIVFCVGIAHAEHVRDEIERQGQECYCIHSKMPDDEKERIIKDFKDKKIKYITNVDMLTTGFNARHIDCIVMMRPTLSAGLYYQMCGRGLRTDENKTDCLILDYAGNILQHGPIDKIEIKTKGMASDRGVHTAPMKECPQCHEVIFAVTVTCPHCGYKYPVNDALSHDAEASAESPLSEYRPPSEHEVMDVSYLTHEKNNRLSMRVVYHTGLMDSVSEWVCIEHGGYAEQKARQWLKKMLPDGYPIPDTVEECLDLKNEYKKPSVIFVDYNQKFPRIISKVFSDDSVSPDLFSS